MVLGAYLTDLKSKPVPELNTHFAANKQRSWEKDIGMASSACAFLFLSLGCYCSWKIPFARIKGIMWLCNGICTYLEW